MNTGRLVGVPSMEEAVLILETRFILRRNALLGLALINAVCLW